MQKIQSFFRTLWRSTTAPSYYAQVLRAKFSFSFKFFTFFNFLIAVGVAVMATVAVSVALATFDVSNLVNQVTQAVPADLVVKMQNGKLSINQKLPYLIPMPMSWQDTTRQMRDKSIDWQTSPDFMQPNLVVFDSDANVSGVADFYSYNAAALVTESFLYVRGDKNNSEEIRVIPFSSKQESWTVTGKEVLQVKDRFVNSPLIKSHWYVWVIGAIIFLVMLILSPFVMFFMMLYYLWIILVASVLAFIVAKIFKDLLFRHRNFAFKQVFQVGLHVIVPLAILHIVFGWLNINLFEGWRFTLFVGLGMAIALWGAGEETAVKTFKSTSRPVARPAKKKPASKK